MENVIVIAVDLAPQLDVRCFRVGCLGRTDKKYSYYLVATIHWWNCTKWPKRRWSRLKTRNQLRIAHARSCIEVRFVSRHAKDKKHSASLHHSSMTCDRNEDKLYYEMLCWDSERLPTVWMLPCMLTCWGFAVGPQTRTRCHKTQDPTHLNGISQTELYWTVKMAERERSFDDFSNVQFRMSIVNCSAHCSSSVARGFVLPRKRQNKCIPWDVVPIFVIHCLTVAVCIYLMKVAAAIVRTP